jgi:hypothetical protein
MVKAQKDSELSPKCESAKREDFEGKNVGSKIKSGSSRWSEAVEFPSKYK